MERCKFCGEQFEIKRGRMTDHCRKDECIKKAHVEAQKRFIEKKKKEKQLAESKLKAEVKIKKEETPKIIYSAKEKTQTKIEMNDFGDILQIARELGSVRYRLVELAKKNNEEVSKYDKEDQKFLHSLEFLEELTDEEAMKMIIEEKKNRELRRNIKNRKYLIQFLLDSILVKNPNAFMVQVISSDENVCKSISKLKREENLYVRKGETVVGCN